MSDQSPPPQLRLRPRKRDDEPTLSLAPTIPISAEVVGMQPVPAESVLPAPSESVEAPARFRLKPKLSAEPEAKRTDAVLQTTVPPAEPPVFFTMPADESAGVPRLKLKSLVPDGAEIPAPSLPTTPFPPIPPPLEVIGVLPTIQLPAEIAGSTLVGALPPVVVNPVTPPPIPRPTSVTPPPPVVVSPLPGSKAKSVAKGSPKKMGVVIGALIAVTIIFGAGIYFFMQEEEVVVSAVHSTKPVVALTPPAAKDAVAPQVDGSQIAPLPPQPSQMPLTAVSPVKLKVQPNAAQTEALRVWVDEARITGVVDGASPRAIINSRLVRPGDMVDAKLGIIFDGLDAERKKLIFRTASDWVAEKSY
jgi:hypothetical protein